MFVALKRSSIVVAIILIAVIVTLGVVYFEVDAMASAASQKLIPIYNVATDEAKVALTFDAAWGADKTTKIMDTLDEYGVKGTFFLVGFWIDEHPKLVKEIDNRGFLIGNHSAYHPHLNSLSAEKVKDELESVNIKLKELIGKDTKYFRAPFGEYNNTVISTAEGLNMKVVQWDVDTLDWKGLSGQEIADRVLSRVKNGSIILMHNNSEHVLEALPIILDGLKAKGLMPTTLEQLIYDTDYTIDNNGTQIKN